MYVKMIDGKAAEIVPNEIAVKDFRDHSIQSRWDWMTFEQVERIAAELTEVTGTLYLPTDSGEWVSPRYDIVEAPKVGDKVSYSFNGDTYPDGEIVKITANNRFIWTSTGKKYLRRKLSGSWVNGRTWTLVNGHRHELNPHF